jgi:acyl-coenzyme A synthetase/AMP-(fatty) acid ligase
MLYERWQNVLHKRREMTAVLHLVSGESVSFGELQRLADARTIPLKQCVKVPSADGLVTLLVSAIRAWRDGAVLMPVENTARVPEPKGPFPDGICHIKLTSGSTGSPKMILFQEEQLMADLESIKHSMRLDEECPNLAVISTTHSYGFSNIALPLLLLGMPAWVCETPLPEPVRRAFSLARERRKRLTLPAVPAMWRAWCQAGILQDAPVRLAVSAGAPLSLDLEREIFRDTGLKIHNFYGSSECGGIAFDDTESPREDGTFAGRAMHRVSLAVDETDCLRVSSPAVAETCWPDEDSVRDGIFHTADLAVLKGEGLHLTGRASDVINLAGRKISPEQIECAIMKCADVRSCAVFGVMSRDTTRVEEIVACVNAGPSTDQAGLTRHLAGILPASHLPRHWWFTDELNADERGKVSRAHWKRQFVQKMGRS